MNKNSKYGKIWKIVYTIYPPLLRILERLGFHKGRQKYSVGFLDKSKHNLDVFRQYLVGLGFEHAILAWQDSDEVLSMRKVDNHKFQYHIRLYSDGEIRGHYEYSSEGNPLGHVLEQIFRDEQEFFSNLCKDYLL